MNPKNVWYGVQYRGKSHNDNNIYRTIGYCKNVATEEDMVVFTDINTGNPVCDTVEHFLENYELVSLYQ